LIGEVVRRITGQTFGSYLRESLTGPAGIDFFVGFGPDLDARCADVLPARPSPESDELRRQLAADVSELSGLASMRVSAYRNPADFSGTGIANTRSWRAAEVPSTNGHGTARGVARLYSALAGNGRLDGFSVLSPEIIARSSEQQVYGDDIMLERPTRFGLGFQLTMAERRLGPNPRAFGHFGAGGSLGFADPDARVAFRYAMNQSRAGWQHKHVSHFIDLLYQAL
jgi:CubicO group peptidase (beta-lactamase class C family)